VAVAGVTAATFVASSRKGSEWEVNCGPFSHVFSKQGEGKCGSLKNLVCHQLVAAFLHAHHVPWGPRYLETQVACRCFRFA